jgi:YidC/Oxa1 family membrane protein insertase
MNKTKIILYALLGVVCFALWNAWQKDYPVANTSLAEKQALTSAAATTAANITPGITSTSISANDSAQQNLTTKKQLSQIPENRLIKVKTDVLDISIDPVGGNIARANLLQYKKSLDGTELVQLLSDNPENLSLSESGLISAIGPDLPTKQATYVTTKKNYILNSNQNDLQVALLWRGAKGLSVSKTFVFEKGSYDIKVNYDINNNGKQVWNGQFYAQLKNKYIPVSKSFFKYSSFSGFAISSPDKPYQKFTYDKLNTEKINVDIQGGWLAMQQPYFLSAWVPDKSKTLHYL